MNTEATPDNSNNTTQPREMGIEHSHPIPESMYPSFEDYDLQKIRLRSHTRETASDIYEDGGLQAVDARIVNDLIATFANKLIQPHLEDREITITTTRYNEKVIIVFQHSRDHYEVGNFTMKFRKGVQYTDGKRHYLNKFRDTMIGAVAETIEKAHKMLSQLEIPPSATTEL